MAGVGGIVTELLGAGTRREDEEANYYQDEYYHLNELAPYHHEAYPEEYYHDEHYHEGRALNVSPLATKFFKALKKYNTLEDENDNNLEDETTE